MAKTPGTPKPKTAAPAQFDMNSRDRKKGGKGPPGHARDDKRPPSRVMTLPPTPVDRGDGWTIQKVGKIDQASHTAMGAEYHLVFEGHDPLVFQYLGAARDRSKEPPPEKVSVVAETATDTADEGPTEGVADPVEEATAEAGSKEEPGAELS